MRNKSLLIDFFHVFLNIASHYSSPQNSEIFRIAMRFIYLFLHFGKNMTPSKKNNMVRMGKSDNKAVLPSNLLNKKFKDLYKSSENSTFFKVWLFFIYTFTKRRSRKISKNYPFLTFLSIVFIDIKDEFFLLDLQSKLYQCYRMMTSSSIHI